MFCCEFCKIFKNIFCRTPPDDCILCLSVNFQMLLRSPVLQSTSGKLISSTSCQISTTRYRNKVFHKCFSTMLYKNKKQLFKGQKQPPEMFHKKRYSQNFCNIHRKTPAPESPFNKVAGLRYRCFPVNFTKFLRTTFLQNTLEQLLLESIHLPKIPGNYL